MSSIDGFDAASFLFCGTVERVPHEAWDRPGLGTWDVRGLVGHTSRALLTVIDYLALDEPTDVSVPTAADYYGAFSRVYTSPDAVHRRGVDAGRALGDDPAAATRDVRDRALAVVDAQPAGQIVSVGGMGIPLEEYLQTRTFELVVHTMDLARAVDLPLEVPPALVESTVTLAAAVAVRAGTGEHLLLALTGREALPPGFSVV
jgi:uncharacterized protein (TIGR03083 family)